MSRQLSIAAYDVADARRLTHARERVRGYATGGQKSAFECLLNPAEQRQMLGDVAMLLDDQADSFLLLTLDPRTERRSLGVAQPARLGPFFYQG